MRKRKWVHEDGLIDTEAFVPDLKTSASRQDGGHEASVNWEDDSHAEAFTLGDRQNAEYGAARLARSFAEQMGQGPDAQGIRMFCERKSLEGNRYHGNLVFRAGLPGFVRNQVAAALASKARYVPPPKR